MKVIRVSGGVFAFVDDEDFDRVSVYAWRLLERQGCRYAVRNDSPNEMVFMHRVVLNLPRSPRGNVYVDHINRNGLDNRKANLRTASSIQNQGNKLSARGTSSRFKGVCWNKKHQAYDNAALEKLGEFACLNFPRRETLETFRKQIVLAIEQLETEKKAIDAEIDTLETAEQEAA